MQLGGWLGSRFETPVRAWNPGVSNRDPSPLAHERMSKMKIKIMKRIKRKSTIKSRIYFPGLPLSYSRDEFLLINPMSIRTML
jgi:hypothetical protein